MIKQAQIQLNYKVSDSEKALAEESLLIFDKCLSFLEKADKHLDIIYIPFKESPQMSSKDVMASRAELRNYRDEIIDKFNEFKIIAFKSIGSMKKFSSDTQIVKLIKSFISEIDFLEYDVNKFSELFNNLQDSEFVKKLLVYVDKIKKRCTEINIIIDERIKTYIQNNILNVNWTNRISKNFNLHFNEQKPLLIDLYNKTQQEIKGK